MRFLKVLKAVTLIIPLAEGLVYTVGKVVKELREAFRGEGSSVEPPPGGEK